MDVADAVISMDRYEKGPLNIGVSESSTSAFGHSCTAASCATYDRDSTPRMISVVGPLRSVPVIFWLVSFGCGWLVAYLKAAGISTKDFVLQLDGETAMNAGNGMDYLESKGIRVLVGWPARSPDLSGIENMWAIVQKRVDSHGPEGIDELWQFVKQEWDAIPASEVEALVASFPRRCKRCIAGGGKTICTKFAKRDR